MAVCIQHTSPIIQPVGSLFSSSVVVSVLLIRSFILLFDIIYDKIAQMRRGEVR
jgi:hypothetical protein